MLYYGATTKSIAKQGNQDDNETRTEPARFQDLLSDMVLKELDRGWQGVVHRMVLQQLPIEIMEEKFNQRTTGISNALSADFPAARQTRHIDPLQDAVNPCNEAHPERSPSVCSGKAAK